MTKEKKNWIEFLDNNEIMNYNISGIRFHNFIELNNSNKRFTKKNLIKAITNKFEYSNSDDILDFLILIKNIKENIQKKKDLKNLENVEKLLNDFYFNNKDLNQKILHFRRIKSISNNLDLEYISFT